MRKLTTNLLAIVLASLSIYQIANAQCDPTVYGDSILCPNDTGTLSTQVYHSYQWYKRAYNSTTLTPIKGETSQTISISSPKDILYYFSVEVMHAGCTEFSPEMFVEGWVFLPMYVISTGDFTLVNGGEIVCIGDTMYYTISPDYINITWYDNGNPISGATSNILPVTTPGQYAVSAASSVCPNYTEGLGGMEPLFINCTIGVNNEQFSSDNVSLYPNPAHNSITIKSEYEDILDINIYNSVGQLIRREVISDKFKTMDVSALNQGIYLMEVNKKTGKERHKFIIK